MCGHIVHQRIAPRCRHAFIEVAHEPHLVADRLGHHQLDAFPDFAFTDFLRTAQDAQADRRECTQRLIDKVIVGVSPFHLPVWAAEPKLGHTNARRQVGSSQVTGHALEKQAARARPEGTDDCVLQLFLGLVGSTLKEHTGQQHRQGITPCAGDPRMRQHRACDADQLGPRLLADLGAFTLQGLVAVTEQAVQHVHLKLSKNEGHAGHVALHEARTGPVFIVKVRVPCQVAGLCRGFVNAHTGLF